MCYIWSLLSGKRENNLVGSMYRAPTWSPRGSSSCELMCSKLPRGARATCPTSWSVVSRHSLSPHNTTHDKLVLFIHYTQICIFYTGHLDNKRPHASLGYYLNILFCTLGIRRLALCCVGRDLSSRL